MQLAWATRGQTDNTDAKSWRRPREVHRTASKNWCAYVEGHIQTNTPAPGLTFYAYDKDKPEWAPSTWRTWSHLNLGHDLGSDGNCGHHALQYKFAVNSTKWPDFDHGNQRGMIEAMTDAGIYDLWLLCAVSWNFNNGWNNNDYRFHQIKENTNAIKARFTPRNCSVSRTRDRYEGGLRRDADHFAGREGR